MTRAASSSSGSCFPCATSSRAWPTMSSTLPDRSSGWSSTRATRSRAACLPSRWRGMKAVPRSRCSIRVPRASSHAIRRMRTRCCCPGGCCILSGWPARGPVVSATGPPALPSLPAGAAATVPVDQLKVLLRPTEIRYVQQESVLLPPTANIKALYVNAWAFGSPKLWQLVRLADETEINAFVVDVKDDTGCLLYPSAVPTAQQIGANQCVRAKDARARLDSLHAHGIYPIARIVVAKDPLLAERKPQWSVKDRDTGGVWRDRINIAWVDAYNDSVWIY